MLLEGVQAPRDVAAEQREQRDRAKESDKGKDKGGTDPLQVRELKNRQTWCALIRGRTRRGCVVSMWGGVQTQEGVPLRR
jgi:hypothetical protein